MFCRVGPTVDIQSPSKEVATRTRLPSVLASPISNLVRTPLIGMRQSLRQYCFDWRSSTSFLCKRESLISGSDGANASIGVGEGERGGVGADSDDASRSLASESKDQRDEASLSEESPSLWFLILPGGMP